MMGRGNAPQYDSAGCSPAAAVTKKCKGATPRNIIRKNVVSVWWCLCYVHGISPRWGLVLMSWSCTVGDAHRYYISPRWGLAMMCWECDNGLQNDG